MTSESCLVNSSFLQVYADFYYALILFSSFMLLMPLVTYIVIAIWLSEIFGRKLAGKCYNDKSGE